MKRYFSLIFAIAATVSAQIVPSTGNVRGPTSATDNAVARYDGTTGKLIQNSGVTIDDSGKLQLATHTTSAGGIGFGTDVSLYRQDQNTLVVQPTGSSKKLLLYGDGTNSGIFNSLASYEAVYFDAANHNVKLATNGFTALTLDSSQNATFVGSVRPEATPSSKWGIDFAASGTSGALVSIANDGTYDLAVGSGMVFLWDDGGNGVSQIATYYGITAIVWQSGANLYSTTVDTANKVNVYYNAGTNKYRIQNKFGSTVNIYVSTLKLRAGS